MKKIFIFIFILISTIVLSGCNLMTINQPLSAPTNLKISGSLLTWDSVKHAIGYTVKIDSQEVNCNESQFELAQLSLSNGTYYVMVKARSKDATFNSDYSAAIEYTKVVDNGTSNTEIDTTLNKSRDRYSVSNAPLTNGVPPLMASYTDNLNNYYLVDGGYIKNTPIVTGPVVGFNGVTPISVTFEESSVTTEKVEESLTKTISESLSEISTGSASFNIGVEAGTENFKVNLGAEYSRQWGTTEENSNSTANTYSVASEVSKSIKNTISYSIGEHGETVGYYRLSMVSTCDVYYLVSTSRDNSKLIEINIVLCARSNSVRFIIEYSEDGSFGKTSDSNKLSWPDDFYKNYDIPEEAEPVYCNVKLNVEGGYSLEQNTITVELGKKGVLPVPSRYNYGFIGWYDGPNGQGKKYTDHKGNLYENWSNSGEKVLYAYWVLTFTQVSVGQIRIPSQEIQSPKSTAFNLGLDIVKLKEAGYSNLKISISGSCSEYDYKMNERGRYFVLNDALTGADLLVWQFKVQGFSGVGEQTISINNLNETGQYQLYLISDKSDAYNEKLLVSNIVLNITAFK